MNPQSTQFNQGKPLSLDQISSLRSQLKITPPTASQTGGNDWSTFDKSIGKTTTPAKTGSSLNETGHEMGQNMSDEEMGGVNQATEGIKSGADSYSKGVARANSSNNIVDQAKGELQATGGLLHSAAQSAIGAGRAIFAPITAAVKTAINKASDNPELQKLANTPAIRSWLDSSDSTASTLESLAQQHPTIAKVVNDVIGVGSLALGGGEGDEILGGDLKSTAKGISDNVVPAAKSFASNAADLANTNSAAGGSLDQNAIKSLDKTPNMVGRVAQGKSSDIPSFTEGLKSLDLPNIKTYSDLAESSKNKIGEYSKLQDQLYDTDVTPRKASIFDKTVGTGDGSVTVNHLKDALSDLKNFYSDSKDTGGLSRVNKWINREEKTGLTPKEINQITREYGTEFKSKAFSKMGDPLTSTSAARFENTRSGLKNDVRGLIPNSGAQDLDTKMSNLFKVKDLSSKMSEKVQKLSQRMENPNVLKKVAGFIGKGVDVATGGVAKTLLKKILTESDISTMNPVELESKLPSLLKKIDGALDAKGDSEFVDRIKNLITDMSNDSKNRLQIGAPKESNLELDTSEKPGDKMDMGTYKLGKDPSGRVDLTGQYRKPGINFYDAVKKKSPEINDLLKKYKMKVSTDRVYHGTTADSASKISKNGFTYKGNDYNARNPGMAQEEGVYATRDKEDSKDWGPSTISFEVNRPFLTSSEIGNPSSIKKSFQFQDELINRIFPDSKIKTNPIFTDDYLNDTKFYDGEKEISKTQYNNIFDAAVDKLGYSGVNWRSALDFEDPTVRDNFRIPNPGKDIKNITHEVNNYDKTNNVFNDIISKKIYDPDKISLLIEKHGLTPHQLSKELSSNRYLLSEKYQIKGKSPFLKYNDEWEKASKAVQQVLSQKIK